MPIRFDDKMLAGGSRHSVRDAKTNRARRANICFVNKPDRHG
jgi:hypothetical protein